MNPDKFVVMHCPKHRPLVVDEIGRIIGMMNEHVECPGFIAFPLCGDRSRPRPDNGPEPLG